MNLILHIETATNICSVAIAEDGLLRHYIETNEANVHSSMLTAFIERLFVENNSSIKDLKALAVSKGPGSYTGLRIGVSAAKGICYGLDIPLISVNTLQSLSAGFLKKHSIEHGDYICPMIDARRMEVYLAYFDYNNKMIKNVSAQIIDSDTFDEDLSKGKLHFFGNGSAKCEKLIQHKNAIFYHDFQLSAVDMIEIANEKYKKSDFEDTAYFEPYYLKDFIATKPKKML